MNSRVIDVDPVDEHNERANREAERDWRRTLGEPRALGQEIAVREAVQRPTQQAGALVSPMERDPKDFAKSLEVRGVNRATLVRWLKDALKTPIDYGRIHFVKKQTCNAGANCTNPTHFTKDTLFKPGAQKICGMLGVTPVYPNLARYEEAAMAGQEVKSIILRCTIVALDGSPLAEGVGARSLSQDYGDLNKALKMAAKSALIDATLALGGLSEIFSHPDQPPPPTGGGEEPDPAIVQWGQFKGTPWAEVSTKYLEGVIGHPKPPSSMKNAAKAELDRRAVAEEFNDDIPF